MVFAEMVTQMWLIISGLAGTLVAVTTFLYKKNEQLHESRLAEQRLQYEARIKALDEQRKSYKEIAEEAVKVAEAKLEDKLPKKLAPVVPEHASPTSKEQEETAELATLRQRVTAVTLAADMPPREHSAAPDITTDVPIKEILEVQKEILDVQKEVLTAQKEVLAVQQEVVTRPSHSEIMAMATVNVCIGANGVADPADVTCASGDTVEWHNDDTVTHVLNLPTGDQTLSPNGTHTEVFTSTTKYTVDGTCNCSVTVS